MSRVAHVRPANHPTSVAENLLQDLKAASIGVCEIMQRIEIHIEEQHLSATQAEDVEEMQRLENAKPFDWHAQARQSLQAGLMFARRAVEQPETF